MPVKSILVAVDRIEGSIAVLEADDGRSFDVPVKSLKDRPKEGMVYRIPVDSKGKPDWTKATSDPAEASRRKKDLGARMAALRKKDPGGDTSL